MNFAHLFSSCWIINREYSPTLRILPLIVNKNLREETTEGHGLQEAGNAEYYYILFYVPAGNQSTELKELKETFKLYVVLGPE